MPVANFSSHFVLVLCVSAEDIEHKEPQNLTRDFFPDDKKERYRKDIENIRYFTIPKKCCVISNTMSQLEKTKKSC